MKFKKIYIWKKEEDYYIINTTPHPSYDIYFTDEVGYLQAKSKEMLRLTFKELPKPLLKQIK